MFNRKYDSDIVLGKRYRDAQTGVEGVATAIAFFQYACERVTIELVNTKDGEIKEYTFDAPRLTDVESGVTAVTTKTGGPRESPSRPSVASR